MDATTGDVSGASVQIGDPITEKLLIDLLHDAKHLYRSITDCGAGGLSSAIGEMAEGVGADVGAFRCGVGITACMLRCGRPLCKKCVSSCKTGVLL